MLKGSKYPLLKNEIDSLSEQKEKLKKVSPILEYIHNLEEEFRTIFEKSQNWGEGTLELIGLKKHRMYILSLVKL